MNALWIGCIFLMGSSGAWAASRLSLADSIRQGLNASPEIQKAESEKAAADAEYRQARAKLFPTIDLNASAGGGRTADTYGGDFAHAYKARLDLEQPLYTGGVIQSGLKSTSLKMDAAVSRLRQAKQDFVYKIVDSYLKAAQAQGLLEIAKDNRTVLKNYLDITSRYAAIGRSKAVDRLQAEASYHLSESGVLEAESTLESLRQDLVRLLGGEFDPESTLDPKLDLQSFDPGPLDKVLARALADNPSIRASELDLQSLTELNRAKMVDHRPRLSLKGSWGYDSPERDTWLKDSGEAYSVSVNLKVPLFSGLGSFAQYDQFNEQRRQAEKDLMIKRLELRKSIVSAMATLQRDFRRLRLTQDSATSSKKAMDLAVSGYRNGLLNSTDVLNIQRNRFEADRQKMLAQYSYNLQILELRRDLGVDLEKAYSSN